MQKTLKIAVLIFNKSDQFCNDKQYLAPLFAQENLIYEEVIWDMPGINWKQYDAVVIRSTCDYFEDKYEQFLATLKQIENQGIPLLNSYEVVRWNSKKNYLADLHSKGINIIETILTPPEQTKDLATVLEENNWHECIIKPAISGGAYKTFRFTKEQAQDFDISAHFKPKQLFLIQPFAHEIIDEGEWSFIFFDKKFSHAMLSKPKKGDFRVQFFHGGILAKANPPLWMIAEAQRILEATGFNNLLYARVDVIRRGNKLYLMELELIEPYLYWAFFPESAQKFVNTLKNYLKELL